MGQSHTDTNNWELTNNTSFVLRNHSLKAGVRVRWVDITQFSPQNFGGTFRFLAVAWTSLDATTVWTDLTSIERYQRTVVLLEQGLTGAEIRLLGGGATQFTLSSGNPESKVSQWDFGGYVQDDWKAATQFHS